MSDQQIRDLPAQRRGAYKVGPVCPPIEHQFKSGQSGNPAGSPKTRTNRYKHIGNDSGITNAELAQLDLESLTQSEQAALKIVKDMATGKRTGAGDLAKFIMDREEGKTPGRHVVEGSSLPLPDPAVRAEWLEKCRQMELDIADVAHAICRE